MDKLACWIDDNFVVLLIVTVVALMLINERFPSDHCPSMTYRGSVISASCE